MFPKNKLVLIVLSIKLSALLTNCQKMKNEELSPLICENWAVTESAIYTPETLYEYINGGAEVYRAHNFVKLYAYRYENPGQPEILADVFEMASVADAYGVYHHDHRESPGAGIGTESELSDNTLFFRKNKYFVSLIAFDETEEALNAVKAIAQAVAGNIEEDDTLPELISLLPEGMRPVESPKYFHHDHCLNDHYYLFNRNVLNLDGNTSCTLAKYGEPGQTQGYTMMLIVKYPSAALCRNASDNLRQAYFADADEDGLVMTEDSKWAGSRIQGNYLVGVFDASTRDTVTEMLTKTQNKLQ